MLFKRREAESWLNRVRVSLWPRRSWGRSTRYVVHRVRRLSATRTAVALGFAAGVFISATPFIGFHMILSATLAWIVGGSIVAALLGTFIGNPLTYPLFWVSSYEVGSLMLGRGENKVELDLSAGIFQTEQIWTLLKPMTLGSIPIGIVLGLLSYALVRPAVNAYQHRRRDLRSANEVV
ncbi:hypothetical protein AUC70_11200 [Methyloceanibacter stevinii]|uniref:DUF2062 domain-containing protein n=1 Tax=Methyloceanibacter stevinii TaxID=1774970 RepID=A0A1E3VL07_9HYPH|nr:DUF2062 domain-containing protein [Methyloceanibacter stevinii]ODR94193.1 hypothetical protein AUC70_11200 [Methyloceanibacter stevinii]